MTKWPEKNIVEPHENDILLGRGGSSIHNEANVRYRTIVREHKKAYQTLTRLQKTQLAESLVSDWQNQNPPGRFLELDAATSTWYCITEKSARRKTSQLLREGAPKIRRQIKEESNAAKAAVAGAEISPTPPPLRTPSPPLVPIAPAQVPPPRRNSARGPTRTPLSKQAKAKLKAKQQQHKTSDNTPAPTPGGINVTPATPNRNSGYVARTTRPPLAPHTPRMATPSPQMMFATPPPVNRENWPMPGQPQRGSSSWQPWPGPHYPYGSPYPYYTPHHHHHHQPPAPAPVPATPTPSTGTVTTEPLKPITPEDTKDTTRCMPPSNPTSTSVPCTPKPKLVDRSTSTTSLSKPIALERKPSAPSPESVLDFIELTTDPISSWDCSADEDLLVPIGGDPEPAVLAAIDDEALHLPHLGSPCRPDSEPQPASLSPPRLEFRKDSHPSCLDTLQTFSFDSFDRMESLIHAEGLGDSSLDILNELDQEMDGDDEFVVRACHSF